MILARYTFIEDLDDDYTEYSLDDDHKGAEGIDDNHKPPGGLDDDDTVPRDSQRCCQVQRILRPVAAGAGRP